MCDVSIKMKPPQTDVGMVKTILWWNRGWIADRHMPRFPLIHNVSAQTVLRKNDGERRGLNGGTQTSSFGSIYVHGDENNAFLAEREAGLHNPTISDYR